VVGPNGSGKSNLAEAVRWVLGEQSARQLRGRRSEDVIFGGGQQRAPQGMAEVTLILEDGEGRLPAGMAEAAVGRRLYRTGESEYYVNRARVRLRDVVDLLARSGVGQQGHAVIGQGQVDLALSLRPEERRGLFEDAAGVRRYQLKRDEAEARLAEVHTNATRIADLIAELEPRLARDIGAAPGGERRPEGFVADPRPLWGIGLTPQPVNAHAPWSATAGRRPPAATRPRPA
jgi:chromosome segregation protein